jgi:glutathione S-transferase
MLTIWGRPSSFNTQKVMWLADELGLAYQHIPAGGSFGGLETPQFLAMNPHGRVPVIADDGTIVWESHAILRYLAARYGKHQFWSDDPSARARVDTWMDWAQTSLQPDFLMGVFWAFYRTPDHARNWEAIRAKIARCAQHFRLLDRILSDRLYLCANSISLADIPAGTALYRYFELDIERPSLSNVEAWYRRLASRPAYRTWVMRPFDELRRRLDP